ncbi:MAG: tRNA pseudouridine(13) synthase TruD [Candidatus Thorarchaeota archaeon]|nr:MAG: tRNA pseudouridine(13) synthase TruD [Candidatus Thorarchaeota archaeon]
MLPAHPLEQRVGMEFYCTDSPGLGGRLRERFEDFIVEEITPEGSVLSLGDWSSEPVSEAQLAASVTGERSKYVKFTLQKMGLSTLDAAGIISAALKIPRYLVTYAGLKDKRAMTVQAMSVSRQASVALGGLRLSRIVLRDLEYVRRPVQVGDLWGNRFTLLLKNMTVDCNAGCEMVESFKGRSILNYFGIQRFGVTQPSTLLAGKALIKRDYESAVRRIVAAASISEEDTPTNVGEGSSPDTEITESMLDRVSTGARYERSVIQHLIKHPGDYQKAMTRIPPRILTLLVHSYQSYLFNRLLSERVRSGSSIDQPEIGDFIIQLDETHSGRDSWLYTTERTLEERRTMVRSGRYGLAAPVPGYSTKLPPSRQSDYLRSILSAEGVALVDFRNPESRALDSPGGLHLVSMEPSNLCAECTENSLRLQFSLRKGSYATVFLRELMKGDPRDLI